MALAPIERPITPGVFARLAEAARYAIGGAAPASWFGPQHPLPPQAPPEVAGRRFDYPFGANLAYTPRSSEAISFAELRGLADALPLLRAVIETRKDQIAGLSHAVRPRGANAGADAHARARAAEAFLARPDRRHNFVDWLRMLIEDMLVIDAATLYPRYDRGGNLYAIDIVDGATIFPLIGEDGRAPAPPDPAYQQILHGVPAADFSADELLYLPRNARAHRLYGFSPVEARDQSQIELYGPRTASVVQAHEICDATIVGPIVAQSILQRNLYVRTRYSFKLSFEYCLLDPMDVVSITDANLGLKNAPARILSIEEDDRGILALEAEELVAGVSTPVLYPNAAAYGFQPNQAAPAATINTPLIYEPPVALSGGAPQIWLGASGGTGGAADPNWGGANVWLSVDNVSFSHVASIAQPLRQGVLSAALASAPAGWDAAHTLSVDLTRSAGALSGASQAAAQQGATASLVDSELIAYQSATPTGANAYSLTGLQRGMNGAAPTSHSAGAPFARLDAAVVKYALPANLVGRTMYLKFQSFNVFGGGVQNLADCALYSFVPTGAGSANAIAAQLTSGVALDLGAVAASPGVVDDFGAVVAGAAASVNLGTVP